MSRPYTLGIIAGSGPEAGMDLWGKILTHTKARLGEAFRGDLDAPRVIVLSEPSLGLSMDLARYEQPVWDSLSATVAQLAPQVDAFAIACNTLNWYAPRIEQQLNGSSATFVSFQNALRRHVQRTGITDIGLLAAGPVMDLGPHSAYAELAAEVNFEPLSAPERLHQLIFDIKRLGSDHPSLAPRLAEMVNELRSQEIWLACTELPLIASPCPGKSMVDVTSLVAEDLVERALAARSEDH